MLKIICIYKQQVLPICKDKDRYYCVFIKEDIHRSQYPVSNSSLDKILQLYKDYIDTSKYITSEDYDLELEVNYKDEVRNYYNLPSADDTVTKFITQVDREKIKALTTKDMKINFTFGDTVTINLTQNKEGSYIYTPKNDITSPIQFFSVRDAVLFFSEFLLIKMYDKEKRSLVNIEYKNVGIAFYMSDEDRTKSGWIDYTTKSVGFSNYLKVNKKSEDSIDDTIKHFINFVDREEEIITKMGSEEYFHLKMQENTIAACGTLVQQILEDFPNSTESLCNLLLDFKYKLEEGVGQKE